MIKKDFDQLDHRGFPWWTALTGILAVMWVFSGLAKVTDPQDFVGIIKHHGLLSATTARFAWLLGLVEAAIGVGLVLTFGRLFTFRIVVLLAILMLVVFIAYLSGVAESALLRVGCGCDELVRRALKRGAQSRAALIGTDVALLAAHSILLIDRRRAVRTPG